MNSKLEKLRNIVDNNKNQQEEIKWFGIKPQTKTNEELKGEEKELKFEISQKEREEFEKISQHFSSYKLSEQQLRDLEEKGYIVVQDVIEKDLCDQMVVEIFQFLQKNGIQKDDHNTWQDLRDFCGFADLWQLKKKFLFFLLFFFLFFFYFFFIFFINFFINFFYFFLVPNPTICLEQTRNFILYLF